MFVTLSGIVMLIKLVQPKNAQSPILLTLFGIVTAPSHFVPSIRILFTTTIGFFFCCALSHGVRENASMPILVTLFGIFIWVKRSHWENAE